MAVATAPTPSPKELWEAYPLKPKTAERIVTATPTARAAAPAAVTPKRDSRGGGVAPIVIGGAAVLAFAGGLLLGRLRRRQPPEPVAAAPEPVEVAAPERSDRFGREEARAPAAVATAEPARATAPPPRPVARPPAPPPPRAKPAARAQAPVIAPRVAWPEGTEAAWRCEITWHSGYLRSEFRAQVNAPGARRRRAVATSPSFKNLMKDPADVPRPELASAVRDLAIALEAQGWTSVQRGGRWYRLRFVWTRPEPPPGMEGAA